MTKQQKDILRSNRTLTGCDMLKLAPALAEELEPIRQARALWLSHRWADEIFRDILGSDDNNCDTQ